MATAEPFADRSCAEASAAESAAACNSVRVPKAAAPSMAMPASVRKIGKVAIMNTEPTPRSSARNRFRVLGKLIANPLLLGAHRDFDVDVRAGEAAVYCQNPEHAGAGHGHGDLGHIIHRRRAGHRSLDELVGVRQARIEQLRCGIALR